MRRKSILILFLLLMCGSTAFAQTPTMTSNSIVLSAKDAPSPSGDNRVRGIGVGLQVDKEGTWGRIRATGIYAFDFTAQPSFEARIQVDF